MHTLKNFHAVALVALVLAAAPVQAAEAILAGRAETIDDDTIKIRRVTVRLKGIAAPERNEPGGKEATEAMRRLIGNREVRCELTGELTHGREVGYCFAAGTDLNREMVRGGWALSCPRYSTNYVGMEPRNGLVQRVGYRLPTYCVPSKARSRR